MSKIEEQAVSTECCQPRPSSRKDIETSLAICIPTKNRRADLMRCIRSIEHQTHRPDRVIIIDQSDQKTDLISDLDIEHHYDPRIRGAAAARNVAIHLTHEDLIFFLDDDCELYPDCVAKLLECCRHNPDAIAVQAEIVMPSQGFSLSRLHSTIFRRGFFNNSRIKKKDRTELRVVAGGATAFRRSLFDLELFDERLVAHSYGEDWEFAHRARERGSLVLAPDARLVHHASPMNRHKYEQILKDRWGNSLYFYDKLEADKYPMNRFWRIWWMLGESLLWLRAGLGFPLLGIKTKKVPRENLSLDA